MNYYSLNKVILWKICRLVHFSRYLQLGLTIEQEYGISQFPFYLSFLLIFYVLQKKLFITLFNLQHSFIRRDFCAILSTIYYDVSEHLTNQRTALVIALIWLVDFKFNDYEHSVRRWRSLSLFHTKILLFDEFFSFFMKNMSYFWFQLVVAYIFPKTQQVEKSLL